MLHIYNEACCPSCNHEWRTQGDVNEGGCPNCGDCIPDDIKQKIKEMKRKEGNVDSTIWNGEGVPKAGQRVRVKKEWLFVGVNSTGSWVLESPDSIEYKAIHPKNVKPLQTKQEKEQEVLEDELIEFLNNHYNYCTHSYHDLAKNLVKAGYRKYDTLSQEFSKGDDYPYTETDTVSGNTFIAGISSKDHVNIIECYGKTLDKAIQLRDEILARLK